MRSARLFFLTLLAVALSSSVSMGQAPRDPAGADALFEEGKALLRSGEWPAACDRFQRSMDLDASVSTLLKIARCREHEGRVATAWALATRARTMNEATSPDSRRKELDSYVVEFLSSLGPRTPRIAIHLAPPEARAEVQLDGRVLDSAASDTAIRVDPGEHHLVATAPGFTPARATIALDEGDSRSLLLVLLPVEPPASSGTTVAATSGPPDRGRTASASVFRPSVVALGATGVLGMATATYLGVRTVATVGASSAHCGAHDVCTERGVALRDEAARTQRYGILAAVFGALALGGAITIALLQPGDERRPLAISFGPSPRW